MLDFCGALKSERDFTTETAGQRGEGVEEARGQRKPSHDGETEDTRACSGG